MRAILTEPAIVPTTPCSTPLAPRCWHPALKPARTHSGLISAFSLHLVKTGRVAVELGRAFNPTQELRTVADYKGDPIEREDGAWAVKQAADFVQTIRATFMPKPAQSGPSGSRTPKPL